MKVQEFYKEFINQAVQLGLPTLLSGLSLYLDKEIDALDSLLKIEVNKTLKDYWTDRKEQFLKLEGQIDCTLDVVTEKVVKDYDSKSTD